jgi:hypothetical protein
VRSRPPVMVSMMTSRVLTLGPDLLFGHQIFDHEHRCVVGRSVWNRAHDCAALLVGPIMQDFHENVSIGIG